MRLNHLCAAAALACLAAVLTGCARDIVVNSGNPAAAPFPIPLSLRGQSTTLRLEFPAGRQTIEPGQFTRSEVCYLKAGDFRIDCYPDGSVLNLGPNDSTDLLTDNAAWNLEPDEDNKSAVTAMRAYAVITLIAGSVDRLPTALSDYLQNPGQHLTEALVLTDRLLSDKPLRLPGFAKGGNFTVTVELNDDGREKLMEAIDEMGDPAAPNQIVRSKTGRASFFDHRRTRNRRFSHPTKSRR